MNKIIGLYIIIIFLILFLILFNVNLLFAWIIPIFTPFFHKLLEGTTAVIFILIFLRANKLYSQTGDKRMAIIAGSFLAASFLNIFHLIFTQNFPYDALTVENIKQQPVLIYLLTEQLIISISIFIAVFFTLKSSKNQCFVQSDNNFRRINYFIYLCLVLSAVILDKLILPLLSVPAFYRVLLFEQGLSIVDISLYFLTTLILADRRLIEKKSIFSVFIIGLLILGVGKLFITNPQLIGTEEILGHFLKIAGFMLIFIGIKEFQLLPDTRTIRQKLLAWLALFLIMAYVIFSSFISTIFNINLPSKFPYIFLEFLLSSAIFEYAIAAKLTLPISNISEVISKYMPEEKSEKIKIFTNDEIGILTDRLNNILEADWNYKEELSKNEIKFQQLAENKQLLFKITNAIRSTLDINETLTIICDEVAKLFNVQRTTIVEFPKGSYEKYIIKKEYKASPDIKGLNDIESYRIHRTGVYWAENIFNYGLLVIDNISESDTPDYFKKSYELMGAKSIIGVSIKKGETNWGGIFLSEYNYYRHWSQTEINFLQTITEQINIAITQAELYTASKNQIKNERILREIINEIKISQNLDEVYKYIVTKIANIYDIDRSFFIEIPEGENEKPIIKYEYCKPPDTLYIDISDMPEKCFNNLLETVNKEGIAIVRDTAEHYKDDEKIQNFFKTFNIKSALLVPLIRYNHDIKLLGNIILCSSKIKEWISDEINFIKAIIDSTITVIWEIKKRMELEELRNTFLLTLTHDLQIPLVAEQNALKFIVSASPDKSISEYKEIISELLKNNDDVFIHLKKLIESYKYDSGQKILNLTSTDLGNLINKVISLLKEIADSKQISITTKIQEDLPQIQTDTKEIEKVLYTIIENSITYTQKGGNIIIKSYRKQDKIITSVTDNGPGLTQKVKNKLFERYSMTVLIERKIGAGLNLYIAKQIIEAHKGRIWYETELDRGTTFNFTLPV